MIDEDFHDHAAIASLQGRLANPNICHTDARKLASAAMKDADALVEAKDRAQSLSFTAAEVLRRNEHGGHER